MELSAEIMVDLRATGMRVRLRADEHAEAVSAAALDLGLAANPAVLQHLNVVLDSANPSVARRFWQRVLDYAPGEGGGSADPLRRDPAIRIRRRPSHGRRETVSTSTWCGLPRGRLLDESEDRWRVADPEGNEVVIVSGACSGA